MVCNRRTILRGTVLHRVHSNRFSATGFNPGLGKSRFAPFAGADGRPVPTSYAASSFACAAFETVFHDIDPAAAFKTIPMIEIEPLVYSQLRIARDLDLASLFEPDLNRWRCTRGRLIDTPPSTYAVTRRWSTAVHASDAALHGMIWTSRRNDEDKAMMLFGDRVQSSALELVMSEAIATSPEWLSELVRLADSAGITLTM